MKKAVMTWIVVAALSLSLAGCGKARAPQSETPGAETQAAPSGAAEPTAEPGRQDGERFEAVIILEGMEETVRYEHIRNDAIGIEIDYDYESFVRRSESGRECFLSVWDDPGHPENYLELTYSAEDADTVAASVRASLSQEYDLIEESRLLERAGSCLRIEASELKGTGRMADQLQVVYLIPAADGCRVAAAHYSVESAEGFGRRFSYMLNTLSVLGRNGEQRLSGTWQTASMAYEDGGTLSPEYYVRFTDSDIHYGHIRDGQFVLDHSDRISRFEETAAGGFLVQAESSNGVRYSYRTCESDGNILEYYETWNEADFPEMYRGGASLSRSG